MTQPTHSSTFDFSFEVVDSIDEMRRMIAQEVMSFKANKEYSQQHTNANGAGTNLKRRER